MNESPSGIQPVILMLADISGYTNFMVSNAEELEHSQEIISRLIEDIIEQVRIPLRVSKLEGDAVFFYAIKEAEGWDEKRQEIAGRLPNFLHRFQSKLQELIASTTCECGACRNIDVLKLKLIVHSGKALLYHLGEFAELSGIDVILVHRLLKNSIPSHQYIIATQQAFYDGVAPEGMTYELREETYEDLGTVRLYTYYA